MEYCIAHSLAVQGLISAIGKSKKNCNIQMVFPPSQYTVVVKEMEPYTICVI